jgi:hypothetical protein
VNRELKTPIYDVAVLAGLFRHSWPRSRGSGWER